MCFEVNQQYFHFSRIADPASDFILSMGETA
jgi:hypothetical protein